jgi:hypothetical protein
VQPLGVVVLRSRQRWHSRLALGRQSARLLRACASASRRTLPQQRRPSSWPPSQPAGAPQGLRGAGEPSWRGTDRPCRSPNDRTSQAATGAKGCFDRLDDEVIGHPAPKRRAHDPARAEIGHRGEGAEALLSAVTHIAPVRLFRGEVLSRQGLQAECPRASWCARKRFGVVA